MSGADGISKRRTDEDLHCCQGHYGDTESQVRVVASEPVLPELDAEVAPKAKAGCAQQHTCIMLQTEVNGCGHLCAMAVAYIKCEHTAAHVPCTYLESQSVCADETTTGRTPARCALALGRSRKVLLAWRTRQQHVRLQ